MNIKEVLVKANINNNFSNFVILKIKLDFSNRSEPTLGLFKNNVPLEHIYQKNDINDVDFSVFNLPVGHQVLLVKILLQNGQSVTKKIMF